MADNSGSYLPPSTPSAIKAHGEVKTRISIIWFSGIICSLLMLGGFTVTVIRPEVTKDIWLIVGPLLSVAITGTVGFLAADRSKAN